MLRFTLLPLSVLALLTACGGDDDPSSDDDDDTSSSSVTADSSSSGESSSSSESTTDIDPTVEPDSSTGEPLPCDVSTELAWVRDTIVTPGHPCRYWVDDSFGRVGQLGTASASVWTRRTFHGTAIALSAAHLLGEGAFGVAGTDIPAQLVDPNLSPPVLGAVYPNTDGTGNLKLTYSGSFQLFNPEIPAAESGDMLANIQPRHDFYLTVVDGQNLEIVDGGPDPVPEALSNSPLQLYDPNMHSIESPTLAAVDAGELVAVFGVPTEGEYEGRLVYSMGRVLDDAEAEAAIAALDGAGDPAGELAYDPEAEFLVETVFAAGMIGGGVFDEGRIHVGMSVRASAPAEGELAIVRAVRTPFIAEQLQAAYDALDPKLQAAVGIYLEAE